MPPHIRLSCVIFCYIFSLRLNTFRRRQLANTLMARARIPQPGSRTKKRIFTLNKDRLNQLSSLTAHMLPDLPLKTGNQSDILKTFYAFRYPDMDPFMTLSKP